MEQNWSELKQITEKLSVLSAVGERKNLCNGHMYEIIDLVKQFQENPIIKNIQKIDNNLTKQLIRDVF
jgi:hypothetical protein